MFNGQEDHDISLAAAAELTKRYRDQKRSSDIKGGYFGKDALQSILDQENCVGIRFYYGLDAENKQVMVLAGVLANQDDITDGVILEGSLPCPHFCGEDNELNS